MDSSRGAPIEALIRLAPEVEAARAEGRPIVALESTLISHGLPCPDNLETAQAMEAAVRAAGAVPATVGVISGVPTLGLSGAELELLATSHEVTKASRRDLPLLLARGGHGSTTVAGTLALIGRAGLPVLATGGIGGVHRGAERSFDLSADLAELARARALVVCSGAKAILDLPKTVELLETLGITLLGYRTSELPAFYTASSGLPVAGQVECPAEAAAVYRARLRLDLEGAVLLGVPPPAAVALSAEEAATESAAAVAQAEAAGLRGREVTPYLLDRMVELSDGRSLAANRALLVDNARVGGEVAVALAELDKSQ
jgi:pseudouridine-5'-phosphate glycosidase